MYGKAKAASLPFAERAMARAAGLPFIAYAIAKAPGLPFLTSGNAITIARGMARNYVTTLLAILVRRKGQVLLPFLSHYRSLHLALLIDLPPYSKDRYPLSNGL